MEKNLRLIHKCLSSEDLKMQAIKIQILKVRTLIDIDCQRFDDQNELKRTKFDDDFLVISFLLQIFSFCSVS